jgi:hypothetical protein
MTLHQPSSEGNPSVRAALGAANPPPPAREDESDADLDPEASYDPDPRLALLDPSPEAIHARCVNAIEAWPIQAIGTRPADWLAHDLLLRGLLGDARLGAFHALLKAPEPWMLDRVARLAVGGTGGGCSSRPCTISICGSWTPCGAGPAAGRTWTTGSPSGAGSGSGTAPVRGGLQPPRPAPLRAPLRAGAAVPVVLGPAVGPGLGAAPGRPGRPRHGVAALRRHQR